MKLSFVTVGFIASNVDDAAVNTAEHESASSKENEYRQSSVKTNTFRWYKQQGDYVYQDK